MFVAMVSVLWRPGAPPTSGMFRVIKYGGAVAVFLILVLSLNTFLLAVRLYDPRGLPFLARMASFSLPTVAESSSNE